MIYIVFSYIPGGAGFLHQINNSICPNLAGERLRSRLGRSWTIQIIKQTTELDGRLLVWLSGSVTVCCLIFEYHIYIFTLPFFSCNICLCLLSSTASECPNLKCALYNIFIIFIFLWNAGPYVYTGYRYISSCCCSIWILNGLVTTVVPTWNSVENASDHQSPRNLQRIRQRHRVFSCWAMLKRWCWVWLVTTALVWYLIIFDRENHRYQIWWVAHLRFMLQSSWLVPSTSNRSIGRLFLWIFRTTPDRVYLMISWILPEKCFPGRYVSSATFPGFLVPTRCDDFTVSHLAGHPCSIAKSSRCAGAWKLYINPCDWGNLWKRDKRYLGIFRVEIWNWT